MFKHHTIDMYRLLEHMSISTAAPTKLPVISAMVAVLCMVPPTVSRCWKKKEHITGCCHATKFSNLGVSFPL